MKKKFTMLFAALSLMITASAQVLTVSNAPVDGEWDENTTWYIIRNKKGGYVSSATSYVNDKGFLMLNNSTKPTGDDALWCVVGNEADGYKFYNKAAGVDKILSGTGKLNSGSEAIIMTATSEIADTAIVTFDIAASQQAGYLVVKDHGSNSNYWNNRDNNLAYWNSGSATNDNGSSFVFATEAQLATALTTLTTSLGEANATLTASGLAYASTEIALQVTEKTAAGYISCSNIDPTEGNDMSYLIDNKNDTYIHTNWHSVSSSKDYLDVYLGAGNGVSLLQFSEVTRGDAQADFPVSVEILGSTDGTEYTPVTTVSGLPTKAGANYTSPVIDCDPSYVYLRFIITGNYYSATRPYWHMAEFDLYSLELTINEEYRVAMSEYMVLSDNISAIQSVANDANADLVQLNTANETLQGYMHAIDVAFNPEKYALKGRIEELSAYLAWGGTAVGYYPVEKINTLSTAIEAAQAVFDNEESVADDYATALTSLNNTFEGLDLVNSAYMPESDKYYTIRNAYSNILMNVNANGGLISTNAGIGIGEIFQFVPAEGGKFYLKNVERGTFLSTAPAHQEGQVSAASVTEDGAKPVAVTSFGVENRVSIIPEGGATIHHDAGQSTIVGWTGEAGSRSAWRIEEVDITGKAHKVSISDVKWSTLVLGYDAVIPTGVTAYAVTGTNATHAVLTEVTGIIPAYEAVLLNGAVGSYSFKVAESATAVEGNLLKGSTINTYVAGDAYVLAAKEGVAGLYKAALNVNTDTSNDITEGEGEETTTTIVYDAFLNNAFKAYLVVEGAEAPMFSFGRGEGTTAIDAVELTNANAVIYDLAGRRVEKMEKGIYIVNGKKVIK